MMSIEITREHAQGLLPPRPPEAHKGTFGHLLVLAGSRGFTGAAKLTCEAAARSGVGLVTAGVPSTLGDAMAAALVEAMSVLLPATAAESFAQAALEPALEQAAARDAVVLGPGISQHPETRAFVEEFVRRCSQPTLLDADALNNLAADPRAILESPGPRVLTPHPGEMARLTGQSTFEVQANREALATQFAREHCCVLVLKGHRSVVADPGGAVYVNPTGNAGMATGGVGDVLSGLIGGLLAQGMAPCDAAVLGVYVHGLAGDIAAASKTERALIARDLIAALPEAWRTLEQTESL